MAKEERLRIVKAVEDSLAKKHTPDPNMPKELAEMLEVRRTASAKVRALIAPVVEAAKQVGPLDPNHIHSEVGRARLLITMQKLYVDELRKLDKESVIFLLALAWAEFTLNEFV